MYQEGGTMRNIRLAAIQMEHCEGDRAYNLEKIEDKS